MAAEWSDQASFDVVQTGLRPINDVKQISILAIRWMEVVRKEIHDGKGSESDENWTSPRHGRMAQG